MARYGIIDLGSNTIRLCIYEVDSPSKTTLQKKDVHTLLNYKIMAGLAAYVKDGAMTKKGVKRAINTINAHLRRASHFSCERIDIFATAVLRNCSNSTEATAAIEEGCSATITILSNWDEAHLGFIGASLEKPLENGTLIDIGGGSTELTRIAQKGDSDNISIPQGSLSSFALHVEGLLPTEQEMDAIARTFRTHLANTTRASYETTDLFGIGGAIRSAAKVYGDVFNDGARDSILLPQHIDAILTSYRRDPQVFAHRALKTIPDRIHTFIPGCIIIDELFTLCRAERLAIHKCGIREGYLIDRVLKHRGN